MKTEDQQLIRLLSKKIGPVDMELIIGQAEVKTKEGKKSAILINGKRASDNETLALKTEADLIEKTKLWKMITETLRYQAQHRMFVNFDGASDDNWASGKFLLYAISILENTVWACQNPLLLADQKLSTGTGTPKRTKPKL